MPLYIAQSGDLDRCHGCLTDSQTLKDSATQLLIKYKSGALVTRCKKIGLGIQPGICVSLCIFSSLAPVGQTGLMQRSSSGLPTCLKWPTGSPHSNWVQGEV